MASLARPSLQLNFKNSKCCVRQSEARGATKVHSKIGYTYNSFQQVKLYSRRTRTTRRLSVRAYEANGGEGDGNKEDDQKKSEAAKDHEASKASFQKKRRKFAATEAPPRKFDKEAEVPALSFLNSPLVKKAIDIASLVALFATWYMSNIMFNIYNKQALNAFPYPTTCTFIHLLCASLLMSAGWILGVKKAPRVTKQVAKQVLPLGFLHSSGFMLTNMSLGSVAVSLTHTIKSLEPFFTVVLSFIFLGTLPAWPVLFTLIPIVAGVVVASATDVSFNWGGFMSAMGSNLTFQARNVLSKKTMVESSLGSLESGGSNFEVLDHTNLFSCISIAACFMLFPVMLAMDGGALYARWTEAGAGMIGLGGIMSSDVLYKSVLAGLCRTGDVLASYALLSRINPVSHSVGNCVKRVVVIAASIVFFRTPASFMNIVGTALALTGVFMYSMATKYYANKDRPDLKNAVTQKETAFEKAQNFFSAQVTAVLVFFGAKPEKKEPEHKEPVDEKVDFNL